MFIYPDNNRYREHPYIEYDNYASEANWKGGGDITNKKIVYPNYIMYANFSTKISSGKGGGEATRK